MHRYTPLLTSIIIVGGPLTHGPSLSSFSTKTPPSSLLHHAITQQACRQRQSMLTTRALRHATFTLLSGATRTISTGAPRAIAISAHPSFFFSLFRKKNKTVKLKERIIVGKQKYEGAWSKQKNKPKNNKQRHKGVWDYHVRVRKVKKGNKCGRGAISGEQWCLPAIKPKTKMTKQGEWE